MGFQGEGRLVAETNRNYTLDFADSLRSLNSASPVHLLRTPYPLVSPSDRILRVRYRYALTYEKFLTYGEISVQISLEEKKKRVYFLKSTGGLCQLEPSSSASPLLGPSKDPGWRSANSWEGVWPQTARYLNSV